MTISGLDAYGALPISELGSYLFVGRYIAQQPGKCITKAEYDGYLAANKTVILVYEDNAADGEGGSVVGAEKAQIAKPILDLIGWPQDRPVYFAFDMPGYSGLLPTFLACAQAFADGIDRPVAGYGDVDTCTYFHDNGVEYLWQFGEGRAPGMCVWQGPSEIAPWGQSIDPDEAYVSDFGQYPFEEDPLTKDFVLKSGETLLNSGIAADKIVAVTLKHPRQADVTFTEVGYTDVNGVAELVCMRTPDNQNVVLHVAYNA